MVYLHTDLSIFLVLLCGTVFHLNYVTLLVTSLLHLYILNSLDSDLSASRFLKKLKTHLFHCSFPP